VHHKPWGWCPNDFRQYNNLYLSQTTWCEFHQAWTLLLCLDWSSLTVAKNNNTCDTYMHAKSWSTPESFEFASCIPVISRKMPIYIEWNLFKRQHAVAKINKNHVIVTPWICIKFQTTRRAKVTLLWCIIEMMCTRRFPWLRILKGGVTQQIFVFLSALPKKMDKEEAKPKLFHASSYFRSA